MDAPYLRLVMPEPTQPGFEAIVSSKTISQSYSGRPPVHLLRRKNLSDGTIPVEDFRALVASTQQFESVLWSGELQPD